MFRLSTVRKSAQEKDVASDMIQIEWTQNFLWYLEDSHTSTCEAATKS